MDDWFEGMLNEKRVVDLAAFVLHAMQYNSYSFLCSLPFDFDEPERPFALFYDFLNFFKIGNANNNGIWC